jgi:hypothetical protein
MEVQKGESQPQRGKKRVREAKVDEESGVQLGRAAQAFLKSFGELSQEDIQSFIPDEDRYRRICGAVHTEVQQLVKAEGLLKTVADSMFDLHALQNSECRYRATTFFLPREQAGAVPRLEFKRDFYRSTLTDVEAASQALQGFRERLIADMVLMDKLCVLGGRKPQFMQKR